MKKLSKIIAALLIVAMALSMVACGKSADAPKDDAAKSETGTVKLRMIESLTSPDRTALLREILDKFEAAHPGVKVELISPPLSNADEKISQMLMAKQDLDVLEVREQTLTQFANNKQIEDMQAYVDKWEGLQGLNDTAKADITRMSNGAYLIPYGFYQRVLYYNKKHFEEAGVQPPTTFAELHDIAVKLTDPAKNRYGYSFRGGAGGMWYADMQIQAYVGDIDTSIAYFKTDGTTIFADPKALTAIQDYKKLYEDCSPKDSLNWSYAEMVQGFVSGTTSMLIQDPEVIMTCESKMEKGSWGTVPLPVGPSGKSYGPMGYAGWGMTSYSKNKDLAWELIAFLSNEENNTYFCTKNSLLPIHKNAAQNPFYSSDAYKAYMTMGADTNKWVAAFAPNGFKGWGEYMNIADASLQKYLTGQVSDQDLMKQWDAYWVDQQKQAAK